MRTFWNIFDVIVWAMLAALTVLFIFEGKWWFIFSAMFIGFIISRFISERKSHPSGDSLFVLGHIATNRSWSWSDGKGLFFGARGLIFAFFLQLVVIYMFVNHFILATPV